MNLTRNIKIAIISIAALFVFFLNLKYVFFPKVEDFKKANAEYVNKKNFSSDLENLKKKEAEIDIQEKNLKYTFLELDKKLPRYFVPENFVEIIVDTADRVNKGLNDENRMKIQDITFTKPSEYKGINVNLSQKFSREADQRIRTYVEVKNNEKSETETEEIDTEETAKEVYEAVKPGEMQFENIQDDKVINVDITFKFSGQSQPVKSFLAELENNDIIMAVKTISLLSGEKKGYLQGQATVTIFGYKNDRITTYSLWKDVSEKGTTDIFSSENSKRYDIDNSNIGDFRIIVNRANDDAPSIILRKAGVVGSDIYGDERGVEKVELYLSKKDGKYSYRYKTQSASYPADAKKMVEFVPTVPDNIIVKVFSTPRIANDTSGMDLTIYNETGAKIEVKVYNDDESSPRVTHRTEEIPVKGDNNER